MEHQKEEEIKKGLKTRLHKLKCTNEGKREKPTIK